MFPMLILIGFFYNVQHYNLLLETDNIFADYEKVC